MMDLEEWLRAARTVDKDGNSVPFPEEQIRAAIFRFHNPVPVLKWRRFPDAFDGSTFRACLEVWAKTRKPNDPA